MQTEEPPKNTANRLQLLKQKALQNNNKLFKVSRPEVLRQQFVDWNAIRVKPWHEKRSDLTDYFNYGFNEHTFQQYSAKIGQKLEQNSSMIQNSYRERLGQKVLPYEQAQTLKDLTPIDYGGLNVPFDQNLIKFGAESNNLHFLDSIFFLNNLNYDTSMLSEFDCYCTSEDLLYGNEHIVNFFEEMNLKLQQENDVGVDQQNFYQFEQSIKKLTNSLQRFKQNLQPNVNTNIQSYPHLLVVPGQFSNKNNPQTSNGSFPQNTPLDQLAPLARDFQASQPSKEKLLLLVNPAKQYDEEDDDKRKKKKDKKIKKDKKDKKDKKRRKNKKDKKHKRSKLGNLNDIDLERLGSDRYKSPKQVIFNGSESSSPVNKLKSPPRLMDSNIKRMSSEEGLPSQQGNQGISLNQNDGNIVTQQPKPVWFIPSEQSSSDNLQQKEDIQKRKRPTKEGAWPMNQIQGILQGNLVRRSLLKKGNKEN